MSDDFWDEFAGDRTSFDNVGDSVTGTLVARRTEQGKGGGMVPVVTLKRTDTGKDTEVWASPVDLKTQLAAYAPEVGDKLRITLTELRHTGQASPMKVFKVEFKKGDESAVPEPEPEPDYDGFESDLI